MQTSTIFFKKLNELSEIVGFVSELVLDFAIKAFQFALFAFFRAIFQSIVGFSWLGKALLWSKSEKLQYFKRFYTFPREICEIKVNSKLLKAHQ